MSGQGHLRRFLVLGAIWAALLLAPYWMAPLGGYTALGTRVLVLGLAAMAAARNTAGVQLPQAPMPTMTASA